MLLDDSVAIEQAKQEGPYPASGPTILAITSWVHSDGWLRADDLEVDVYQDQMHGWADAHVEVAQMAGNWDTFDPDDPPRLPGTIETIDPQDPHGFTGSFDAAFCGDFALFLIPE